MFKLTHVRSIVNGDIFVEQPWSTYYDLTHIHGDHITPDIVLVKIEIDWDKAPLFDIKCRVNPRHFEWVRVGTTSNPIYSSDLDNIALIQLLYPQSPYNSFL